MRRNRFFWLPKAMVWRAVRTALVVGTVLNLINQGDVLWGDAELSVLHFLLNYLVPLGVSGFSFMQARRAQAATAAELRTAGVRPVASASCPRCRRTD